MIPGLERQLMTPFSVLRLLVDDCTVPPCMLYGCAAVGLPRLYVSAPSRSCVCTIYSWLSLLCECALGCGQLLQRRLH
jgi:hypothetical protein